MSKIKRLQFIEFLIVGIVMGVVEDLLAVKFATGAIIDFGVVWIVFLVALPFAILSELIVDRPDFWKRFFPFKYGKF
jgi:hypothetical protein